MLPEGAFWERAMRKLTYIALSIAGLGLALSACAPGYYDRYGYYDGYNGRHYGYADRYHDSYYDRDYRAYRDRY
jgi:hypothetical protein